METYVQAWSETGRAIQELCTSLTPDDWLRPTDCPGWTVRDVVAHLAAVESVLAGGDAPTSAVALDDAKTVSREYTEAGVRERKSRSPDELLVELAGARQARRQDLRSLPVDPKTPSSRAPGGIAWDWETLLRNRAIDLWVHEQDIRRAVGRTGGLDSTGARVTVENFAGAMGYVLGKLVAPPPGTTVVWDVSGPVPFVLPLCVSDDGRAERADSVPAAPTAALWMDSETFTVLAAGRHSRTGSTVTVAGDPRLCGRILSHMAVTP